MTSPPSIAPKSIQSHSPCVPIRYRILFSSLLSPAKALLSRHRCLPHPAADFILKPPLSKLLHHLSLHRYATDSAFLLALTLPSLLRCFCHCAAARFIVAPPLPSSLRRQFCLCRRAVVSFLVARPVLPSSSRCRCLCHRAPASSAFVVAPPLPSLSRRCCFRHRAAARFIVTPPLPSLLHRRFCLHCRAAATFLVAPRFCRTTSSAFGYNIAYNNILFTIQLFTVALDLGITILVSGVGIPYTQTDTKEGRHLIFSYRQAERGFATSQLRSDEDGISTNII